MPVSPARAAAFDILLRVDQQDAYASELLHSSRCNQLSSADHGLATELVMGVLRWRSWLDQQIAEKSSQPLKKLDAEVLTALRLAAYQLGLLGRVPPRAAVYESVELVKRARKRSAVPLVNAVLRKLADEAGKRGGQPSIAGAETAEELSERSAHPLWLVERWMREFGEDAARRVCMYDQQVPETAIRLESAAVADELRGDGVTLAGGRLLTLARRVLSGDLSKTRAFREGRVAIQDEASQLVALLVGQGSKILDCCASPGGKTRVLAQRNPRAEILAVELHPHRARLLRRLVTEQNVQIVTDDVRELPVDASFDRVLVDVPCSGTGTLARNPEIKWRLRIEDLADLQARQASILQSAMRQVAPRGRLVYSTCSLEREENLDVVEKALALDSSFHALDCRMELERLRGEGELAWKDPSSLVNQLALRTVPGVHPFEGFFAAVLEKD
jgi:16S rRNA (cytosine967-C5)-methyltransferase